jgi:hypothetical protein
MKFKQAILKITTAAFMLACVCCFALTEARAQSPTTEDAQPAIQSSEETPTDADGEKLGADDSGASAVRALGNRDPQRRQTAAETLARIADNRHRRLVQGYRLQERDARVRLALDWALYRLGKPEALFAVVRELETANREQAIEYLSRLDDQTTLLALLKSPKRQVKTGVLEAIGHVGDGRTARELQPLIASSDLAVAAAAQLAVTQIEARTSGKDMAIEIPTRPRQVNRPANQTAPGEQPVDPSDPK